MAITENTEHNITILSTGHLQVRRSDIVFRDGVEIARNYHRHVVTPGADTTNEIQMVKDVAATVWTPEMIAAAQENGNETNP